MVPAGFPAGGELCFFYRQGSSGDGVWYFNKYDAPSKTWKALLGGSALFGNTNSVNAYFTGPVAGPDGRYHISFMWRDTPDALTCHDISYIRSRGNGLDEWENAAGEKVNLPVTVGSATVADAVPIQKGLINMSNSLGFDTKGRAVISYHKYDAAGVSQVYNARYSQAEGKWVVAQASDWKDYKWDFGGLGSIIGEIDVGAVEASAGRLTQSYRHPKLGAGQWILDEATLKPIKAGPKIAAARVESFGPSLLPTAGPMFERWAWDRGVTDDPTLRYALRWRALDPNRDKPPDTIPPDSRLELLKFKLAPSGTDRAPQGSRRAAGPVTRPGSPRRGRRPDQSGALIPQTAVPLRTARLSFQSRLPTLLNGTGPVGVKMTTPRASMEEPSRIFGKNRRSQVARISRTSLTPNCSPGQRRGPPPNPRNPSCFNPGVRKRMGSNSRGCGKTWGSRWVRMGP